MSVRGLVSDSCDQEHGIFDRFRPHRTGQPGIGILLPRVS